MKADFAGQVALVTGGASGIGAGTARMLAAAGADVVIADVATGSAQAVADEIGGTAVRCDVRVLADLQAAVSLAEQTYGGLDLLMLNAGVSSGFTLDDFDEAGYRRAMGVNLDGVVFGLVAGVPALRRRGGGRIVAVASLAGLAPVPEDPVYAANKAAVVNLVRSVAPTLQADGIAVNALCPGYTDTAILGVFRAGLEAVDWPLMAVDDVVGAVASILASDATGDAWLVQSGHDPQPYRFRGVPGPKVQPQTKT